MSWSQIKASGRGQLAWRLSIEGCPVEFVTHTGMERTTADGRTRVVGLRSDGIKLEERVHLPTAEIDSSGMTLTVADVRDAVTAALDTDPTQRTWLDDGANVTASDATITVASTVGFPSSGTIHIGTEAITYSGTTPTTFTGCTRGVWDTLAAAHYVLDGERLGYPEVTDRPSVLEGRRARLFAYGAGDDKQGSGTQVWLGVVRVEPSYRGGEWAIGIDPITRILTQTIGADTDNPVTPRGIYYPPELPLRVRFRANDAAGAFPQAWFNQPIDTSLDSEIEVSGFFETQQDFVDAVNVEIAGSPIAGCATAIEAVSDGAAGWYFQIRTSASPVALYASVEAADNPIDTQNGEQTFEFRWPYESRSFAAAPLTAVAASSTYYIGNPRNTGGQVPRGALPSVAGRPRGTVYFGGSAAISIGNRVTAALIDDREFVLSNADTATRSADLAARPSTVVTGESGPAEIFWCGQDTLPEIRLGRGYGNTNVGAWLYTQLLPDVAEYVNTGAVPMIQAGDLANLPGLVEFGAALVETPGAQFRSFALWNSVEIGELLREELKLLGLYPALDASGRITFRRVRIPAATEEGTAVTSQHVIVDGGWPTIEKAGQGLYNTVIVRTGYNAREDKHLGPTISVRDVEAFGRSPNVRALEIAPFTKAATLPTIDDVVGTASRVLGVFGGAYRTVTFEVPLTLFDVTVGTTLVLTSSKFLGGDGTKGVVGRAGILIGKTWEPMDARGQFTVLVPAGDFAGYVPEARLSATFTGSSGTVTVNSADLPASTTAATWWEVGDLVRVYVYDSGTPQTITGEVTSVAGDVVGLSLDAGWTPGGLVWVLGSQPSTAAIREAQRRFAYVADADGRIDTLTGSVPGRAFAP
jgi:hypothetical protein